MNHFCKVICLLTISLCEIAFAQDLIISEYVEGTSNNKAIELCNPSSVSVNMGTDNYVILIYFNNATTATGNIALTGTVAPGGSFVIANPSAASAVTSIANITSATLNYNGNDVVVLLKGGATGTVVDSIGRIGGQPNDLADVTLRKKSCALRDTDANDAFDRSVLYDDFPMDTFTNLKTCPASCSTPSSAPTSAPTLELTSQPTSAPGVTLSPDSTASPTESPTQVPTSSPTVSPTNSPTSGIVSVDRKRL